MSSSLTAWRATYTRLLVENGAVTPAMQCMAFATACQAHSLTLAQFVAERKALQVPPIDVFAPSVMVSLSDWDNSWETLQRLLHLEDSSLERIILHYAKMNQPMTDEVHTMFKDVVESWAHASHRAAWYKLQTPAQSERTVDSAFPAQQQYSRNIDIRKKEAIEHSLLNIASNARVDFWRKIIPKVCKAFSPTQPESQRIAKHMLLNVPPALQYSFVDEFQTQWEISHTNMNSQDFGQWVADVLKYQPQLGDAVLERVVKKHVALLESPALSANTRAIDYFLNHGIGQNSGHLQVRGVLNALVTGKGGDALRERAWIKKLALCGAKPSDLKQMDAWTPAMMHAFDYWLATSFEKYSSRAPATMHSYINRKLSCEYERRFQIYLRSPAGFEQWREKNLTAGTDPFGALAVNAAVCDTWEEGCILYASNAVHPPIAVQELNFEFAHDTEPFHP